MQFIEAKIIDPVGFHMRPASILVNEGKKFESKVTMIEGSRLLPAESVVDIISYQIKAGAVIRIQTNGPDEVQALATIVNALKAANFIEYDK